MLLLPTFFAVFLFAVVAFSRLSNLALAREVAFIVAALGAGVIWFYLSLVFESAVGFAMSPAITLGLGLVAGTLAPLFALPQGRTRVRPWLLIATAVTVILATGIAMLVPPFSASAPQQIALIHFDDRDRGTASLAVSSWPGDLPEQMRDRFDADPIAVFPWIGEPVVVAGAQPAAAPAPELQVISDEVVSGERIVKARLRSPQGADSINLHVPVESLVSIVLAGYAFPVSPDSNSNGYYTLQCHGPACDGLALELHLLGRTPIEVLITDTTYGLPASGETLIQARPITAVPAQQGDQTIIMSRVEL